VCKAAQRYPKHKEERRHKGISAGQKFIKVDNLLLEHRQHPLTLSGFFCYVVIQGKNGFKTRKLNKIARIG